MSTNVSQQSTPDFRELLASLSQPLRVTMDTLSGPDPGTWAHGFRIPALWSHFRHQFLSQHYLLSVVFNSLHSSLKFYILHYKLLTPENWLPHTSLTPVRTEARVVLTAILYTWPPRNVYSWYLNFLPNTFLCQIEICHQNINSFSTLPGHWFASAFPSWPCAYAKSNIIKEI